MYKRPARVLFLEAGDGSRARLAQALAPRAAGGWITPLAASLRSGRPDTRLARVAAARGVAVDLRPCAGLETGLAEGCDLVVALGLEGEVVRSRLGASPRPVKAWPLVEGAVAPAGPADLRRLGDHLEARLRGMAGGLRLLARSGGG